MSDKQINMGIHSGTITIATSDSTQAGTQTVFLNGIAKFVEWVTPDMEDTDSTRLDIVTSTGGTVFATGTQAESTRFSIGSEFALAGTQKVVATAQGTQSANRSIEYHIHFYS